LFDGFAMPIWVHRLLGVVVIVAGGFGGAIVGWLVGCLLFMVLAQWKEKEAPAALILPGYCCAMAFGAAFFFGGAKLGYVLSYGLFVRNVPARCPECRARIYFYSDDTEEVRYRCPSCGHEYIGRTWQE
jgi:hypothetical protein